MTGFHEKVWDQFNSCRGQSINLMAKYRKCHAEVQRCLKIEHGFTAGLFACSLLTLFAINSPTRGRCINKSAGKPFIFLRIITLLWAQGLGLTDIFFLYSLGCHTMHVLNTVGSWCLFSDGPGNIQTGQGDRHDSYGVNVGPVCRTNQISNVVLCKTRHPTVTHGFGTAICFWLITGSHIMR